MSVESDRWTQARVAVWMRPGSDRRLVADTLSAAGYDVVTGDGTDLPDGFDCCLVDAPSLSRARTALREAREADGPVYRPCLLVLTATAGDTSDPLTRIPDTLTSLVDDAVVAPVQRDALRRRVATLLRARRLSLDIAEINERYRRLVDVLPEATFLLHHDRIVYCNRAAATTYSEQTADGGQTVSVADEVPAEGDVPTDLHGRDFPSLAVPADRHAVARALHRARTDGASGFVQASLRAAAGVTLTAELAAVRVGTGSQATLQVVVRDVTDRQRREDRLRLYRRAMDEASVGITIADSSQPDNPLVYANDRFLDLVGRSREEVLGRNARFAHTDETDPETVAALREAIDAAEPISVEILNGRRDGETWWNALDVTPVRNGDGEVTHFLGFQRDVTDRVRREAVFEGLHAATERMQNAATRESLFQIAIEAARDALDLSMTVVWAHEDGELVPAAATEMSWEAGPGRRGPGDPHWDVFQDAEASVLTDPSALPPVLDSSLLFPLGEHGLLAAAAPDAESYPPYLLDAGQALADHVTTALDRATREESLRERERELQRYETIIRTAGDPIYTLDAEGNFTSVNEAMTSFTGYDREELLGSDISVILSEAAIARSERHIRGLLRTDIDTQTAELDVETASGELRRCEINIALLPREDDTFRGTVGIIRDITERERQRQRLAVLDRVLRHNIRNKLNVVLGRAAAGRDSADADGLAAADTEAIVTAAESLLTLSEKVREFHKTEETDVSVRDVAALCRSAVATCRDRHPDVPIELDAPPSVHALADDGVELAIVELIENAVVHVDDRPVVSVEVSEVSHMDRGWVEIAVSDNGEGIPEAELAAFTGAPETPLSHATGVGLWLVSWVASRVGGTVTYDTGDDGTTIRIRMRRA